MSGHYLGAFKAMYQAAKDLNWKNEQMNEAVARTLFDPNVTIGNLKRDVTLGEPKAGLARRAAPIAGSLVGARTASQDQ